MKKKFFTLLLALILSLSLAACGGHSASQASNSDTTTPEVNTPDISGSPDVSAPEEEQPQADVDLTAFYNTLREEHTWPELMDLTNDASMTELLDAYYPGLSELPAKQCGVYIAAISAAVGEIALVELENTEDVQKAEEIFQARIDYQVGDDANPGGAWYPETIEGWKNNSYIASNGNYVMLAVGDSAAEAVASFDQLFE